MRLTWLVLGVVVAAGAVAFINTDDGAEELPPAAVDGAGRVKSPLQRNAASAQGAPLSASEEQAEERARALLKKMAAAKAEGADLTSLVDELRRTAWNAPAARRYAYLEGRQLLQRAAGPAGRTAVQLKDRARRLLSRVLYLPEMFTDQGESTDERTNLIQTIQKLNRQVMHYGPGVQGVTTKYPVERGIRPVQIVSRQKLPMGSNAILFWNQGGNLDPKRLRADDELLLPQEELTLHVFLQHRRLGIFVADWFVKEFRVGIGKDETPTPTGVFRVHSRERNPDWWKPGGKRIPFGHADNELGSAWIAFENDEWPLSAGYGMHGTNKPATVGTRCSNGCVRLQNAGATELYDWVRTASAGGRATRVIIR